MPRSHAAPFDPLIAQRTMIAKTESSVFLTGRPAKPADLPNRPSTRGTSHLHAIRTAFLGTRVRVLFPWNGCAWHCDAFQPSMHTYNTYTRAYKGVEARHRHTDTDVEWRVAHEKVDEGIFSEQTLQDRLSIAGLSRIHATSSRRLFLWTYTVLGHVFSTLHLTWHVSTPWVMLPAQSILWNTGS